MYEYICDDQQCTHYLRQQAACTSKCADDLTIASSVGGWPSSEWAYVYKFLQYATPELKRNWVGNNTNTPISHTQRHARKSNIWWYSPCWRSLPYCLCANQESQRSFCRLLRRWEKIPNIAGKECVMAERRSILGHIVGCNKTCPTLEHGASCTYD